MLVRNGKAVGIVLDQDLSGDGRPTWRDSYRVRWSCGYVGTYAGWVLAAVFHVSIVCPD